MSSSFIKNSHIKFKKNARKHYYKYAVTLIGSIALVIVFSIALHNRNNLRGETNNINYLVVSTAKQNLNRLGANDAKPDESISWRKSLDLNGSESGDMRGVIHEEIGQNEIFDGDLRLPQGWSAYYSTDSHGTNESSRNYLSYNPDNPPSQLVIRAINYLKFDTDKAGTLKPQSANTLSKPIDLVDIEDQYRPLPPVIYDNKAFIIMRAIDVQDGFNDFGEYELKCYDLYSLAGCSALDQPTYLSSDIGALGSGIKNINTPMAMQHYLDDGTYGNEGGLYIPAQSGNSYGVACINLKSLQNCGFTALGSSTAPSGNVNPVVISGFVESGGKLYGHANDIDASNQTVVCYDLNTDAICSGYSTSTQAQVKTYLMSEHYDNYITNGTHILSDNKLYWMVNYSFRNSNATTLPAPWGSLPSNSQRAWGSIMTCFDLQTQDGCSAWPTINTGGNILTGVRSWGPSGGWTATYTDKFRPSAIFEWKDTNGVSQNLCMTAGLANPDDIFAPKMYCYDKNNGTSIATNIPGYPNDMFNQGFYGTTWQNSQYITNIIDNDGHHKSYFPMFNTSDTLAIDLGTDMQETAPIQRGAAYCWDWTTQSLCTDFPKQKIWYEVNDSFSADVGYAYNGGCLIAVGYNGHLWSFDPKNGQFPCRNFKIEYDAQIVNSDFYCDNQTHSLNWSKLRLTNGNLYDFENVYVTVKDNNGATLIAKTNIKNIENLDISSISYSAHPQLKIEFEGSVYNFSPWSNSSMPQFGAILQGDSAQVCYKTKVRPECDISSTTSKSDSDLSKRYNQLITSSQSNIDINQDESVRCFEDVKISINENKTRVKPGDTITYDLEVISKSNQNSFNKGNVIGARILFEYPDSLSLISTTDGGVNNNNVIKWDNQNIYTASRIKRSVTFRIKSSVGHIQNPMNLVGVAHATDESSINIKASVVYPNDHDQSDNSDEKSTIVEGTTNGESNSSNNSNNSDSSSDGSSVAENNNGEDNNSQSSQNTQNNSDLHSDSSGDDKHSVNQPLGFSWIHLFISIAIISLLIIPITFDYFKCKQIDQIKKQVSESYEHLYSQSQSQTTNRLDSLMSISAKSTLLLKAIEQSQNSEVLYGTIQPIIININNSSIGAIESIKKLLGNQSNVGNMVSQNENGVFSRRILVWPAMVILALITTHIVMYMIYGQVPLTQYIFEIVYFFILTLFYFLTKRLLIIKTSGLKVSEDKFRDLTRLIQGDTKNIDIVINTVDVQVRELARSLNSANTIEINSGIRSIIDGIKNDANRLRG